MLEVRMPHPSATFGTRGRRVGAASVVRQRLAPPPPPIVHSFLTSFTVDPLPGRPKLQRGFYLLGMTPEVWRREVELPAPGEGARHDLCSLVISVDGPLAEDVLR
jgi:hypothetical protein